MQEVWELEKSGREDLQIAECQTAGKEKILISDLFNNFSFGF